MPLSPPFSFKTGAPAWGTTCNFFLYEEKEFPFINIVPWEVFATLCETLFLAPSLQCGQNFL